MFGQRLSSGSGILFISGRVNVSEMGLLSLFQISLIETLSHRNTNPPLTVPYARVGVSGVMEIMLWNVTREQSWDCAHWLTCNADLDLTGRACLLICYLCPDTADIPLLAILVTQHMSADNRAGGDGVTWSRMEWEHLVSYQELATLDHIHYSSPGSEWCGWSPTTAHCRHLHITSGALHL